MIKNPLILDEKASGLSLRGKKWLIYPELAVSDHKFTFSTTKFGNIELLDEKASGLSITDSKEKLKILESL